MVSTRELARPKRIFVDATFTLASGKNSGIERVVRNLLRESIAISQSCDAGGLRDLPTPQLIVSYSEKFFDVDDIYLAACERLGGAHANILASTSAGYRFAAKTVCWIARWQKLRKWLLPSAGHLGVFKLWHSWQSATARRQLVSRQSPIEARQGDLFILPDAYWINRLRNSVWPAAIAARSQGAFISTVLYDLIPLTHPEFVGEKRRDAFLDYLTKAATNSDLLLAISKTVRDQVREFLPTLATLDDAFCGDIRSFTLGAELKVSTGEVRPSVLAAFDHDTPPYLMVATFDPRKNHTYVLDAFDQLWERARDVRLCLVGRIGARCDEVVERIRQHPLLGDRLFLFDDLSDAELQHCYRNARAVVFPSIVEGFGLPIVEALWFGKKTFASDTPIHREVGATDCVYFKLKSPVSLVQQIEQWEMELQRDIAPSQSARTPTNWRGSTVELLNHCLHAMHSRQTQATDLANERAA